MRFWMCLVVIVIGTRFQGQMESHYFNQHRHTSGTWSIQKKRFPVRESSSMKTNTGPVSRILGLALLGFSGSYLYNLDTPVSDGNLPIPSYFRRNSRLALHILP
jgi:hypothetical protein